MEKRKYYIWGTGKIAKQMNREYGYILGRLEIKGYIDNNKILWGKEFEGKKIYSPNVLREEKEAYLIIANVYKDEIIQQIQNDMLYDLGRIIFCKNCRLWTDIEILQKLSRETLWDI